MGKEEMAISRNSIDQFRKTLKTLMHSDTIILRRQLDQLLRSRNRLAQEAFAARLANLEARLQAAVERKCRRCEGVPRFDDLPHLPITDAKNAIIDSLANHPVTIISGETGSGENDPDSQILPGCRAGHLWQDRLYPTPTHCRHHCGGPHCRRTGLRSCGRSVGYKIRFQDTTDPDAYIKVVTDGILLAETQGDPWLNEYDTIIVDEAHERSLNIDFVLGILKRMVQRPQQPQAGDHLGHHRLPKSFPKPLTTRR